MRRFMVVNTYYQLIVAIQLKKTLFHDDYVCCLISDHSNNSFEICRRVIDRKLFDECHYIKTKGVAANRSSFEKIHDFFAISFLNSNRYDFYLSEISNKIYDEILCFNFYIDIYGLHSTLSRYNKNLKVSFFEEGILSYNIIQKDTFRRKLIRFCRWMVRKNNINVSTGYFYCFYPSLYKGKCKVTAIPRIKYKDETSKALIDIFGVNDSYHQYEKKYIFFSSVYDFEGESAIGEYELVCRIADKVGADNLLIKKHPRDIRKIYEEKGLMVDSNSSIPWEVIQLSFDFSDSVFLTATSGSVLAGSLMVDKPTKTFYMFKLCDLTVNRLAIRTVKDIRQVLNSQYMKGILENVKLAETVDDILL